MKRKYLLPGAIVFLILLVVYFIKNIYPFGNSFISWGDMHTQVLPLYYNFYDVFHSGKSILIGYSGLTAINLIANFSYYVCSPFTFIVLLFSRTDIPQAVSLIVLFKMVLASITCHILLDKTMPKTNSYYKILLSVLYGLSSYNLTLYIISGWMDVVYLFPLLMLGLYQLLKDKKPTLYITILALSLILNFYTTLLSIMFVFFLSYLYLFIYQKKSIKESITLLGISTILSLLLSSILLLPTIIQILNSARIGFTFSDLLSVKTGPLIDKFLFLTSSTLAIAIIMLSIKKIKEDKKWLKFFIPILLMVSLGLVIEPINKMWHFGSYMYYPLRYGFTLILLLIFGALYSSNYIDSKKDNKLITIISTAITSLIIIFLTYRYYNILQVSVNKLTFTRNHLSFFVMVGMAFVSLINYIIIFLFSKKNSIVHNLCLTICVLVFTITHSLIYIKIDYDEPILHKMYDELNYIYEQDYEEGYHFKKNQSILFENYGFIIDKPVNDFFTSLIDNNMYIGLQKLGYDAYAMNTSSSGSNIFIDNLLAQKYIISRTELDTKYYKQIDSINDLLIYETRVPVSKYYLLNNNASLEDTSSSFEATNIIYNTLTDESKIFNIYTDWNENNITYNNDKITITDPNKEAYFEQTIDVLGTKLVYFEIGKSFLNNAKTKFFKSLDIYVNNELVINNYPSEDYNGSIYLGTFEDETITIKIKVLNNSIGIQDLKIGLLDYDKTINSLVNTKDIDINYDKNRIIINYQSDNNKILFIPTAYLKGMTATNNGNNTEIIKVFDNFIGIKLNNGNNNIVIRYTTPGLKIGALVTIITLLLTIIFIKTKEKIINVKWLNNIAFWIYSLLYVILLIVYFIIPIGIFLFKW